MIRPICNGRGNEVNVLKPHLKSTVFTLISQDISQREIHRLTGIDRKTIRLYAKATPEIEATGGDSNSSTLATGSLVAPEGENPPPRPPATSRPIEPKRIPKLARSACEPHREWMWVWRAVFANICRHCSLISQMHASASLLCGLIGVLLRPAWSGKVFIPSLATHPAMIRIKSFVMSSRW
jgi:hypothetical protein